MDKITTLDVVICGMAYELQVRDGSQVVYIRVVIVTELETSTVC